MSGRSTASTSMQSLPVTCAPIIRKHSNRTKHGTARSLSESPLAVGENLKTSPGPLSFCLRLQVTTCTDIFWLLMVDGWVDRPMATLKIKSAESCKWDLVSLGEVMLRLDPGDGRIATARQFRAWEGGGEYNVARGLKRCFGMRTAVVTAFADNPVGSLIEDFIYQGG